MKKNYLNPVTEIVRLKSSNPVMDYDYTPIDGINGIAPVSRPVEELD